MYKAFFNRYTYYIVPFGIGGIKLKFYTPS